MSLWSLCSAALASLSKMLCAAEHTLARNEIIGIGVAEVPEGGGSKMATPQHGETITDAAKPKRKASSGNWDVDVLDGLRAAAHHLPHIPESGLRSLSDIVNTAAREKVAELESAHNDGEPFPRVGRLSAGRKP